MRSSVHWFIGKGLQRPYSAGGKYLKECCRLWGPNMASFTITHIGLGTWKPPETTLKQGKIKSWNRILVVDNEIWFSYNFPKFLNFVNYCLGFYILGSVSLNHLQHKCFLWSLSCCCRRERNISSNGRTVFGGIFNSQRALWKWPPISFKWPFLLSWFCICSCVVPVLFAYKLFTQN